MTIKIPDHSIKTKVLVFSINHDSHQWIQGQLNGAANDFTIKAAHNSTTYVRLLEDFRPGLIIADIEPDGMTDLELLAILREKKDSIPLILLAEEAGGEKIMEAMRAGASDIILKSHIKDLSASMKRAVKKIRATQREKMYLKQLQAIAAFNMALVDYENWEDALHNAFAIIGEAASADRVYYFENSENKLTGERFSSQRIEWSRDSVLTQINNPDLQNIPFEAVKEFVAPLKIRKHFSVNTAQLPDGDFRNLLMSQNIQSCLLLPIFIKNHFHGFLGYDDCTSTREWDENEIDFLKTLAVNFAAAIDKRLSSAMAKESQERLQSVINNIPGISYRCKPDSEWTIQFISDEVERLTGYPPDDFIDNRVRTYASIIHPEDLTSTYDVIKALKQGESFYLQYRIICRSGEIKWVEERGNGVYNADGKLQWIDGVSLDITERKNTSEKFKAIFDQTSEAILLADDEGRYIDCNKAAAEMLGYSIAEINSKTVSEITGIEDENQFRQIWESFINKGSEQGRIELKRKDNMTIVGSYKATANVLPGVHLTVIRDITAQERHDMLLKASERRFKALVQESSDMIAILDREGNYLFVSDSSSAILGIDEKEFLSNNGFSFIHPDDKDRIYKQLATLTPGERKHLGTFRFRNSEDNWHWLETIATDLSDDPAVGGIVVNSRDVTDMVIKENELKLSNERYRLACKATQDVIYDLDLIKGEVHRPDDSLGLFFGYSQEQAKQKHFWKNNIHPDDLVIATRQLLDKLGDPTENFCENEYRFRRADGSFAYVYDKGYIIRNEDEKAIRLIGAARDITEQKNLEKQQNIAVAISHTLCIPGTLRERLTDVLSILGGFLNLPVAEAWVTSINDEKLNLVSQWHSEDNPECSFQHSAENTSLEKGDSLPGETWQKGVPQFRTDNTSYITQNKNDLTGSGVCAVCSFPIFYNEKVIAVFVFVSNNKKKLKESFSIFKNVSSQLGTELQRKKTEDELEKFFSMSPDMLCIIGFDGRCKKANPAFTTITGYTEQEMLTLPLSHFIHPDDYQLVAVEMTNINTVDSSNYFECRIVTRTGQTKWLAWTGTVVPEEQLIYAIAKDVTEKKKIEETLKHSNAQLKTAQAIAKLGYWTHDMEKDQGIWAEETYRIWEQDPEFFKPTFMSFLATVHPEDQWLMTRDLDTVFPDEAFYDYQNRIITPGGKVKWVSQKMRVIRDPKGKPLKLEGIAQDITEQKKLETLLDEVHKLTKIGGWEMDLIRNKLSWTDITKEIHEVPLNFEPDPDSALSYYKDQEMIRKIVNETIEKGTPYDVELRITTAKGKLKWVRALGKGEFAGGKCVRIFGSIQDIHAQKKAEEERREILESITDGFFAVDKCWTVTYWNKAAEQMFKIPKEEILGRNLWEQFDDSHYQRIYTEYETAMQHQEVRSFEEYLPLYKIWIEISAFPKPEGLSVYFKNITREKERNIELVATKNLQESIANSTQDMIWEVDLDLKLTSANAPYLQRMKSITGFDFELGINILSDKRVEKLMAPQMVEDWHNYYEKTFSQETLNITEEYFREGQREIRLITLNPIFDHNGNVCGAACFSKDITERTEHLKAIEDQNTRLREIAWIQSHVVRAPLARLTGLINILEEEDYQDISKESLFRLIQESSEKLDEVIHDMTDKASELCRVIEPSSGIIDPIKYGF
ncbi:MAG: PAS domain S-box protein [Bacteroidia bacterium]